MQVSRVSTLVFANSQEQYGDEKIFAAKQSASDKLYGADEQSIALA